MYTYGDVSAQHHMLLVLIPIAWFAVTALVLALCHMAARGDSDRQLAERVARQSPRRPTTWGTVRSRILTSVHNDQLAM